MQRTALLTGQAKTPSEEALAAFECFAPPRPPPSGGLQHGFGPVGCAALFKACFDKRLGIWPSTDVGGEEGSAADRASSLLEPAAWRGAGGSETIKNDARALSEGVLV